MFDSQQILEYKICRLTRSQKHRQKRSLTANIETNDYDQKAHIVANV